MVYIIVIHVLLGAAIGNLVARRFDPDYVVFMIGTILLQLTLACALKALLGLLKEKQLKRRLK